MRTPKFSTAKAKIFFASDFHLSHIRDFIWKPRGFASFEEHTKAVLAGINEKVGENDILFYLGDFSLNSTPPETRAFFRAIKCKNIYYIWGNHEANVQAIYQEAIREFYVEKKMPLIPEQVYPFKWENVTFLGNYIRISINNQPIVLSHFAFHIWDMMQHDAWNLCGHSHGNASIINADSEDGKIFDVGVDNALRLTGYPCFEFDEVKEIMATKKVVLHDHHNEKTT